MQALEFSVTNGAAATNTATSITFTGTTFSQMAPDRFMVLPDGGDCVSGTAASDVRASGSISTTGITDVFLAPEVSTATKYTVCVANSQHMLSNTTGFTYAGQITVYDFTVLSTFAQLDRVNDLKAWPIGTGTSIYITPCSGTSCSAASADSTCRVATSKYYTSPLLVLTGAPRGTYLVCQQSENPASVVGSNATITVIDPFTLDLGGVDHVKQYVPFDVTLGGGNIPTRMLRSAGTTDYKLRVQPATTTCDETPTESQTFDIIGGANTFTITDKVSPRKDIIFCLVASSKDTINVGKSLLEFYMSPSAIVTDEATVITSSASTTGVVAKVASTASCADTISSGSGAALNTNKQSTQTIVGCSTTNANVKTAYYCESTDGGSSYANRGKMILLRRVGCPGGASASITAVTTAPATAIANFGIDTTALVDPQLSKSSTCADLLSTKVNTNGYVPRYDESAVFYVCARSTSDSTYLFTTTTPTLTVEKYTGTPTSVLSRLNTTIGRVTNTSVTLNYPTPSVQTFFSASTGCSPVISSASGSGFAGSTMKGWYSATAVQNLVYVCTADTETGTQRPIVSLLSVSTPSVSGMSPAIIKGAHFTATLRINALLAGSPLYSMVPGADASYPYADYYVSEDRSVFFSTDACTTTLTGTSAATVGSDGMVSFETSAVNVNVLKSVSLCTGTPAGVGVAVDVPVTNGPHLPHELHHRCPQSDLPPPEPRHDLLPELLCRGLQCAVGHAAQLRDGCERLQYD
ncbi:hypothetical protein AGDE_14583 [Angomonas deanei]|uniref:Uncharacterized protein n=1 Tax=Angomonas deanei TaxID=59799 RepID=A0A7G2CRE8_9TRYP|nr:hypothetical protein AGDE_14583 [Angomonas deanei]CAD2222075.1 hypothetical protein, conserved [Angomonas deanei]|eukprot:EPY20589.1 hypothetical protein AGDE_14583 [Angomonas deanei]